MPAKNKKSKLVDEIIELIGNSRSVMIASVKGLKSSNFQDIRKKVRGKASIKIYKKSTILRALDKIEKGVAKNLKPYIIEDSALLFSSIDPFELSSILAQNKTAAKARPGQEAPEDIWIRAGPTDLMAGPAISQLGALGLKVMVEDGKISIREDKIIVKKGDKISDGAADIMAKVDIKPFKIGFEPMVAYDIKEDKIFTEIKVEKEKEISNLKNSAGRAIAFAFKIAYVCKDTLGLLLGKANAEEKAISKLIKSDAGGQN